MNFWPEIVLFAIIPLLVFFTKSDAKKLSKFLIFILATSLGWAATYYSLHYHFAELAKHATTPEEHEAATSDAIVVLYALIGWVPSLIYVTILWVIRTLFLLAHTKYKLRGCPR